MFGHLSSDETLIQRALQGSERAWVSLVKRHEKAIYNHLLRMTGNPSDAMDVMQDVFLSVYRNLPNYRGEGVFPAWVMRAASNRAIDSLRRRARRPEQSLEDEHSVHQNLSGGQEPNKSLNQTRERESLLSLLATLPAELRLVIELKFFQQYTFEEVAQHIGIPSATAKTRYYRALQELRQSEELQHVI
jgi:RNA polymerase sigma-70 factor (ECF subfamily)